MLRLVAKAYCFVLRCEALLLHLCCEGVLLRLAVRSRIASSCCEGLLLRLECEVLVLRLLLYPTLRFDLYMLGCMVYWTRIASVRR